ncbi:MAG: glutamine--fructose-6-phosphate transaminase (isomerizing) [Parachlamydiales bacterium]|jgi:glucosamine--fructose-6-phosphate aminotransferase (isomerizing)
MCGIFGYLGSLENPLSACLEGLKKLEYRGYDSAGIAGLIKGRLWALKESGKIAALEAQIKNKVPLEIAIGHTRWATHGAPTRENAHPHFDEKETLALVHNGIIENYSSIKTFLKQQGIKFFSETDTEVIAQLVAYHYQSDLLKAVQAALKELKGAFAIALIHKDHPDTIVAASRECPLAIGFDDLKKEILISSDPNAFLGRNLNVAYLQKDEIALLQKAKIEIFDTMNHPILKKTEKLYGQNLLSTKKGYDHFMLKEIFEQPFTIQKSLVGRLDEGLGSAHLPELALSNLDLTSVRQILITACGTSYHAGLFAAELLEETARLPARAEIASELRYKNPLISRETLLIAISQSGETADTLGALREARARGARILAICNVKNSTLAREADAVLFLNAGPEISVCSTKAFTSQVTLLALFTLYMARLRHLGQKEGKKFLRELSLLPQIASEVLNQSGRLEKLALKYSQFENFFFLGRRYMYPACLEAALKLKEISYLNANGYPAGELKHGPIALISQELPVIAFAAKGPTYGKMLSNLQEVKARGAPLFAFAFEKDRELEKIADDVFYLPRISDELAILPASIAGQLFAYFIAKERGREIDQPRNLAKSVTVE